MIEIKCDNCRKWCKKYPFSILLYKNHFCSKKCKNLYLKLHPLNYWLGKKRSKKTIEKLRIAHTGKKLSEEHKAKLKKNNWMRGRCGKLHPNYNGAEKRGKHLGKEYRDWREAVFARDNWTCQKYGIRGGNLEAHHIQNFKKYPELKFVIANGITFSNKAHKEFHKKYGQKNNTRKQLEEFLK